MPGWLDVTLAVVTVVAGIVLSFRFEGRVQRAFIGAARGRVGRAVLTTAGLHLAVLALYVLPGFVALGIADASGSAAAAAPVVVPATALLLVPAFVLWPNEVAPRTSVDELERAGAPRPVARTILLASTPFLLVEVGVATGAVVGTFFA